MDPAILGAMSALMGSLVGGAASLYTAWITQTAQGKRDLVASELRKREALYGEYVTECSKLIVDAIDHTLDQPSTVVAALSILNRIRLTASPQVMEAAEASLDAIVQSYFREKMTHCLNCMPRCVTAPRKFPDPLASFSAACRIELREIHRVR
jgi:hypothetical protein